MKSGIYQITNQVNSKVYIGCAIKINERWWDHRTDLRYNKHANRHLQAAWNKYGEDKFKFERIEICEIADLKRREHYWCTLINVWDRNIGYNIELTSEIGTYERSQEVRDKISKSHKGKKKSLEHCRKISEMRKGRLPSESTLIKLRENAKKKKGIKREKFSDEWIENMKKSHNKRGIFQYDTNGNFIREWASSMDIHRETEYRCSSVTKACNNELKNNRYKGNIWKWKNPVVVKEKDRDRHTHISPARIKVQILLKVLLECCMCSKKEEFTGEYKSEIIKQWNNKGWRKLYSNKYNIQGLWCSCDYKKNKEKDNSLK